MIKVLFLILSFLCFVACHPLHRSHRGQEREISPSPTKPIAPHQQQLETAYHLFDPSCVRMPQGAERIEKSTIYKLNENKVLPEVFTFINTHSPSTLENDIISTTIYGHGERAECEMINGQISCSNHVQATAMAKPLKICQTNLTYDRFSYEGVALTTMSSLQKAGTYYTSIPGSDHNLPRSQLVVLPTIEQNVRFQDQGGQIQQRSVFMTDNMAYLPQLNGKPSFIIFPKGRYIEELGIWRGINLWESEWVVAHEFGHHIFMHHSKATPQAMQSLLSHDLKTHAPFIPTPEATTERTAGGKDLNGKKPPFAAVNEAFADLFAHLSTGNKPQKINTLDCFRQSRDVTSGIFESRTPKILTKEVLEIFGGQRKSIIANILGCSTPDFSELHSIGAIIAHAIHETLALSPTLKDQPSQWSEVLIAWPTDLGKTIGPRVSLTPRFEPILKPLFAQIATRQSGSLTAEQCTKIRNVLPALDASLTANFCK